MVEKRLNCTVFANGLEGGVNLGLGSFREIAVHKDILEQPTGHVLDAVSIPQKSVQLFRDFEEVRHNFT